MLKPVTAVTAVDDPRPLESPEDQPEEIIADGIARFVIGRFESFRRHRNRTDLDNACNTAMRQYQGQYSPEKLAEISRFGGSKVYSRMISTKCRAATALLRDVFLGADKTWGVEPTPDPTLPEDVTGQIDQMVMMEVMALTQNGVAPEPAVIEQRRMQLQAAGAQAQVQKAREYAEAAENRLQDLLLEGGFYEAMIEFLTDLPIYPYACIKGPVVQNVVDTKWEGGYMREVRTPRLMWYRVAPQDVYFTPGVSRIADAAAVEHIKLSRGDLQSMRGLPGYNDAGIEAILRDYPEGYTMAMVDDATRAVLENRESPMLNSSGLYDTLEYTGAMRGQLLLDHNFTEKQVPDPEQDYHIKAWVCGRHTVKVHINPNPKKRSDYFATSYEKIPGSLQGNGIPAIIEDVEGVANACLRSLVNNMSIASGPQVAINEERLSPSTNSDDLYPWKRWRFISDPMANSVEKPIDFFQPQSNANELLGVYKEMLNIADDNSAIPRYMTGSEKVGGAARTASGLSMLLNNASKMLQTVASNIDREIMEPLLQNLYDLLMLTDESGLLRGDENIAVKGVQVAMQKETERMRKLEFLNITGNPIDMGIIGPEGRAHILRDLADDLGMPGTSVVPNDVVLKQRIQAQQHAAQQQAAAPEEDGAQRPSEPFDNAHRTRNMS